MTAALQHSGYQAITLLAATTITSAVTAEVTTPVAGLVGMQSVSMQATFAWGSAGTTAKAWVQTSFDGGTTWVDIACFAFTTAVARTVHSLRANTAVAANYVATDGSLADNTIKDGLLGDRLRVKYTTTGTYADDTTLAIHAVTKGA